MNNMKCKEISSPYCIKVPKIYDWINKTAFINLKEEISLDDKIESDFLCCDFHVPCSSEKKTTLWTSSGIRRIGGSICISFCGCGPLEVFINDKKVSSVLDGNSYIATFSDIRSVEVLCKGSKNNETYCSGEFKITLHYDSEIECHLSSYKDVAYVDCFLSDCDGKPIMIDDRCNLDCHVLTLHDQRSDIHLETKKGDITLQKVDLLKRGFVTVQVFNKKKQLCLQCIYPFSKVETVFLCAPPGTEIECEVTSVDCKAYLVPSTHKKKCVDVIISLLLCQSIISVADVKIEVLANTCKPREELMDKCSAPLPPKDCSFFPTQHLHS